MTYSVPEAYSEFWYVENPGKFRTKTYSESWAIQNPGIFRTGGIPRSFGIFRTRGILRFLSNIYDEVL